MPNTCIIVADATLARFIVVEAEMSAGGDETTRLSERTDLVNPEAELSARELFSDRSGRGHGSLNHGLDDHRDQHEVEIRRRFAKSIASRATMFLAEHDARRLLLVAGPELLGQLRQEMRRAHGLHIVELEENLARRSLWEVQQHLVAREFLNPPPPPVEVFRPRGQAVPY